MSKRKGCGYGSKASANDQLTHQESSPRYPVQTQSQINQNIPSAMVITRDVFLNITQSIGSRPAESGGMLGGAEDSNKISHFEFDTLSSCTGATYTPDTKSLNRKLDNVWNPNGIRLKGMIHSHPGHYAQPSSGDLIYAERFLKSIDDLDYFYMPIVIPATHHVECKIVPFIAYLESGSVKCKPIKLKITGNISSVSPLSPPANKETGTYDIGNIKINRAAGKFKTQDEGFLERVKGAYDTNLLARVRIIHIGTGGAAEYIEELARAGVGSQVLIDPDIVEEKNIGTQQVYLSDVGQPKVEVLKKRLLNINSSAQIIAYQGVLDDITDDDFEKLLSTPSHISHLDNAECKPEVTIICGLTDNFQAQARVNRLALKFALPSMCAQVYLEGRGAEVTFTHPETTEACHRCILSSRYEAYLVKKKSNEVTSSGTPIFSTTRLNAIKGFITLALAHHGSNHQRWGDMLTRIGNRNLIQIRMDPDLATTVGLDVFNNEYVNNSERVFFDEALWLSQKSENPDNGYQSCPDCGGLSDLTLCKNDPDNTMHVRMSADQIPKVA